MPATQRESTGRSIVFAMIVACVAAAFFYLTICRFGYPVQSVEYVTRGLGLNPFPGIRHTLWNHLLTLAMGLPSGSMAFKANLLSVILGAISVGLMAYVMACIPFRNEQGVPQRRQGTARLISGGSAAAFLALSTPIWFISTRANPAVLHVLLLLVPIILFVRFQHTSRFFWLLLMALAYGIGATEYAILYLLLPVFAVYVLIALSRAEQLTVPRILAICASGLIGYSFVVFAAWQFVRTDAARWQGMDSLGKAVFWFVKDQALTSVKSVPGSGWLLITVMCVIPWFLIVGIPPKREESRATTPVVFGSILLHAIITILGVLILFEVYVGPYEILGLSHLEILPYVLAAMWFGYLAGIWYSGRPTRAASDPETDDGFGVLFRRLSPVLIVLIFVGAGFRNFRVVNPVYGKAEASIAEAIVDELNGRQWILTQGTLDDSILLSAADRGLHVRLINPGFAHMKPYARYYRSMFQEPELRAVAEAGIVPLITEWISVERNLNEKLVTLVNPDLWYQAGMEPLTLLAAFAGTVDITSDNLPGRLEAQLQFWDEIRTLLDREESGPNPIPARNIWLRRYMSRIANNAGYALDQLGHSEEAEAAYRSAHVMDSNNISGLANLASIARQNDAEDAGEIREALLNAIENPDRPIHFRLVSHSFGYLRAPRELIAAGHSWAVSGIPFRSLPETPRGFDGGTDQQKFMELIAAGDEEPREVLEAGEKFFLEQLKENPKDLGALFGLARNAMRKGDLELARSTFLQLRKLGMSPPVINTQLGLVEMLAGNREACKEMLRDVVEQYPSAQFPVCLLMFMALEDGNNYSVERLAAKLKEFDPKRPVVYYTLAALSTHRPELANPRENLEALTAFPKFRVGALERLITLDLRDRRRNILRTHVNSLLSVDPNNARAHLALGKLQSNRGNLNLAETSFRKSIEQNVTADALNSLGWVLTARGRHEEALEVAGQAVDIDPDDAHAQDTRAIALMHLGRLEESEAALRIAIELDPAWFTFQLHLLEVLEKAGKNGPAQEILDELSTWEDLSPNQEEQLAALADRLRN